MPILHGYRLDPTVCNPDGNGAKRQRAVEAIHQRQRLSADSEHILPIVWEEIIAIRAAIGHA
jgi:hypothetical protein